MSNLNQQNLDQEPCPNSVHWSLFHSSRSELGGTGQCVLGTELMAACIASASAPHIAGGYSLSGAVLQHPLASNCGVGRELCTCSPTVQGTDESREIQHPLIVSALAYMRQEGPVQICRSPHWVPAIALSRSAPSRCLQRQAWRARPDARR